VAVDDPGWAAQVLALTAQVATCNDARVLDVRLDDIP
jgi:hypothetical protein